MSILRRLFGSSEPQGYTHLLPEAYQDQFAQAKVPHTLVDVRTPGEYKSGHLPGAINIPLNDLPGRTKKIPQNKPVVLVCATGHRSLSGARTLAKAGFENIYNLRGGTIRWRRAGLPLE